MRNFAVFILTNNRPDSIKTISSLRRDGYTGKIYLILDDQDTTINEYKSNYPDCDFYIFNKNEAHKITDTADNTKNLKAVVYARNMTFKIAKKLGLTHFLVLDDDYYCFQYRSNFKGNYKSSAIKNLDSVFRVYNDFIDETPIKCVAMAQGGDFIGGYGNKFAKTLTLDRKCMNSFFCRTDRPFEFYGLINEDATMYTLNGSRGDLYFTTTGIGLDQGDTQQNDGGLTTIYLELGTYLKSFYSVMYHPSSIVVKDMGAHNRRLHHSINRDYTYPKILSENHKRY
jgi:hypothetical protein